MLHHREGDEPMRKQRDGPYKEKPPRWRRGGWESLGDRWNDRG
jgi:hypothetical protein